ncbi:MAG TPA: phage virion morphogenesis protein [Hyphomicrobiales bacterium]|nr:phage virion morphogenesis protein [Hyphomicrobiales bacterium]
MTVQIEIRGLETVIVATGKLQAFDPFRLLTIIGNTVRNQTVRHFQEETGPAGKWAPLKESTVRRKRGGHGQILSDTGRLKSSISPIVSGLEAEIGTNVFYGKFHQYGTRKMVARPFLGLAPRDTGELRKVIDAFILSVIP